MNVKAGDIAICTQGNHEGKIGTVVELYVGQDIDGRRFTGIPPDIGPIWVFEAATHFESCGELIKRGPFPDCWLRPVSGLPEVEAESKQEVIPKQIAKGVPA